MRPVRLAAYTLIGLCLVAVGAPLLVVLLGVPGPSDVDSSSLSPLFGTPSGPAASHPFGVDWLGRDVLARTLYGARLSLFIGLVTAVGAVSIGVALGLLAGFRGGLLDQVVSRFTEAFLVIPYLILALGIATSCSTEEGCLNGSLRPGVPLIVLILIVTSWPALARIVRNETVSLKERDFILAARASGASTPAIVFRELLPNLLPVIAVMTIVIVPQLVIAEAALSFLGVGVPPSTPSWGGMIASAAPTFPEVWWLLVFPGFGLVATVLACTVLADRAARSGGIRWRSARW